MAVAIDTSLLARYFTQDNEELFAKVSEILRTAKQGSIILDRVIIAELGYVLRSVYGLDKRNVVSVYKALLANGIFVVPDRELVGITVDFFDKEKPLSFEDCWLLALKRNGKASGVLTFDVDLAKRISA